MKYILFLWRSPYIALGIWFHVSGIPYPWLVWNGDSHSSLLCSVLYMYLPVFVYGVTGRSNGVISSSPELGTDLELVIAVQM